MFVNFNCCSSAQRAIEYILPDEESGNVYKQLIFFTISIFQAMTGLYIHIPFCRNKCFYCSFIVAIHQDHYVDRYVRSLTGETERYRGRGFDSVYFGGGTPSHLNARQFYFLASSLLKSIHVANNAEITVEMNPEDATDELLQCYCDCGVNRLSLGAQTFQDKYLRSLGRCHDSRQIYDAYTMMRKRGFQNISLDLMYGFPGQSMVEIEADLKELGRLQSEHVSLYGLTIERGSRFFVQGVSGPSSGQMAEQYCSVRDRLVSLGFEHYEVSNFAVSGKSSVHNMNYWQGGNYIGLGVGAHSHQDGRRWWNTGRVRHYIEKIDSGESPGEGHEDLNVEQRLAESVVFGLRMIKGVNLRELEERYQCGLSGEQQAAVKQFVRDGYLALKGDRLKVRDKGLLVLDEISARLL